MQASFTPQEQQEIDRLREKYGGLRSGQASAAEEVSASCVTCSAGAPPTRQAEPSSTSGRAASNVEASICAHCHGTGTLVEIYNHRRLENFCKECDGRGVRVFKNGVEVQPGASCSLSGGGRRGVPTSSSAAVGPAGVVALHSGKAGRDGSGSDGEGEAAGERIAALRRDLQRIAAKAALYAKERLDTLALLQLPISSGAADPEGREQAARGLLAQLDLQLDRLDLARLKKQAALDRLMRTGAAAGTAASVTLADIIANEAPRS